MIQSRWTLSTGLDFPTLEVLWRFFKWLIFNFSLWHSKVFFFLHFNFIFVFCSYSLIRKHCQQVNFIKCLPAGTVLSSPTLLASAQSFISTVSVWCHHSGMLLVSHSLLHSQPNQCPFLFLPPLISSTAAVMMIRSSSWEYETDASGWEEVL